MRMIHKIKSSNERQLFLTDFINRCDRVSVCVCDYKLHVTVVLMNVLCPWTLNFIIMFSRMLWRSQRIYYVVYSFLFFFDMLHVTYELTAFEWNQRKARLQSFALSGFTHTHNTYARLLLRLHFCFGTQFAKFRLDFISYYCIWYKMSPLHSKLQLQ